MLVFIGCLVVLMSFTATQSDALRTCYVCLGVRSFSGCKPSTCSAPIKHCYYEEKISTGPIRIYGGCATDFVWNHACPMNVSLGHQRWCRECCDTNLCNTKTCSVIGIIPHHTTQHQLTTRAPSGPICFSCKEALSVVECNQVTMCKIGEHCSMEIFDVGRQDLRFTAGCASTQTCTSNSFPTRSGHKICSSCCEQDYCNSDVCSDKVKAYSYGLLGGTTRRQCFQCYDTKLEEIDGCYNKVECAHTSSCTQVLRNESGILTVDMDCEENLPCTSTAGTDHDVCDICCNWDFCNREIDCRYPVSMTTSHSTVPITEKTTPPLPQSTMRATPTHCYQCSDIQVDTIGNRQLCYNIVSCFNPTSKCTTAYSMENGLTTANMDCEENLPCNQPHTSPYMCSSCCDTDLCNQDLDCRKRQPTNQPSTILPSTIQPSQSRNYTAVECEVCSGAECGVDSRRAVSIRCNNTTPYCLNTVLNHVNGDKHVTKRCGSVLECESKWLQQSSLLDDCLNFDPSNIYSHSFECTYCCVIHNCNRNIRPQNDTLYNPGVYLP